MSKPDLRVELQNEEAARHAQGMPSASRSRVWKRLSASVQPAPAFPRPGVIVAGLACVAALAMVLLFIVPARPPGELNGFPVTHASEDLRASVVGADLEIQAGQVILRDEQQDMELSVVSPATLRREDRSVRLVRGTARFSVTPREPAKGLAVVLVSGGAIEVLGTQFTVEQGLESGQVAVSVGKIRFVPLSPGEPKFVSAGESLQWPMKTPPPVIATPSPMLTPVPEPELEPEQKRVAATPSVEEVLREVDVLRSRRQFERAARLLSRAMGGQPRYTRERLSYELGSLMTHQLRDRKRACGHWRVHEREFRAGRYAEEISQARALLRCGDDQ